MIVFRETFLIPPQKKKNKKKKFLIGGRSHLAPVACALRSRPRGPHVSGPHTHDSHFRLLSSQIISLSSFPLLPGNASSSLFLRYLPLMPTTWLMLAHHPCCKLHPVLQALKVSRRHGELQRCTTVKGMLLLGDVVLRAQARRAATGHVESCNGARARGEGTRGAPRCCDRRGMVLQVQMTMGIT